MLRALQNVALCMLNSKHTGCNTCHCARNSVCSLTSSNYKAADAAVSLPFSFGRIIFEIWIMFHTIQCINYSVDIVYILDEVLFN